MLQQPRQRILQARLDLNTNPEAGLSRRTKINEKRGRFLAFWARPSSAAHSFSLVQSRRERQSPATCTHHHNQKPLFISSSLVNWWNSFLKAPKLVTANASCGGEFHRLIVHPIQHQSISVVTWLGCRRRISLSLSTAHIILHVSGTISSPFCKLKTPQKALTFQSNQLL